MWVDLLSKDLIKRPLKDVLEGVAVAYQEALESEVWSWVLSSFDFRHAVVLCYERPDGSPVPLRHTPLAEELAGQLLTEWGHARGGVPCGKIHVEAWDFKFVVGYGMAFMGAYREPETLTRLTQRGSFGSEVMRDREEQYIVPAEFMERLKSKAPVPVETCAAP